VDYVAIEGGLSGDRAVDVIDADVSVDGVDGDSSPGRPVSEDGLPFSAEARAFLRGFRQRYTVEHVIGQMQTLSNLRACVVGDTIIDEYHFVRPFGMPLKSPIIAAQFLEGEAHAGGVLAVANHLAGFCKEVHLVTALGAQDAREEFVRRHLRSNVTAQLFTRPDAPTTIKRRYLRKFLVQKLFEVSFFNDQPLPHVLDVDVSRHLSHALDDYDLVVVADFGHGFVSRNMIEVLCRRAKFLAVNAQMNSVNMGYHVVTRYPRADYVCIDEDEVRMSCRDRYSPVKDLIEQVAGDLACRLMTVTRGHHGSLTYQPGRGSSQVPVLSREVVDTIGAGDAYLSITAPCACAGFPPELIGFIGNAVGALAVKILGNQQPVTPEMLYASVRNLLS
jgi:bifunctional ADP-heptose synthase (sugar kinase/adenylyltransferase)